MKNNKKTYLIIGAFILAAVLIILEVFVYCQNFKPQPIPTGTVSTDTLPDDGYYHKKPIKLELMNEAEKSSFGISTSSAERVQVLERDASGNPTVYRLISSDADILTEY